MDAVWALVAATLAPARKKGKGGKAKGGKKKK